MGRTKKFNTPGTLKIEGKLPPVLYGLEGIMTLFQVSKATASRYKNGILKDACASQGKVIVVNVEECLRLFGVRNPERLIDKKRVYERL